VPYWGSRWSVKARDRREAEQARLRHQSLIPELISEIEQAAPAVAKLAEEAERKAKIEAEKWEIDEFFRDVEDRLAAVPHDRRNKLLKRLQQARALLGDVNALQGFVAWKAPDER
jgi:hypothetical protein